MKEYTVKISFPAQVVKDVDGLEHPVAIHAEDVLAMYEEDPTEFTAQVMRLFMYQVHRDLK